MTDSEREAVSFYIYLISTPLMSYFPFRREAVLLFSTPVNVLCTTELKLAKHLHKSRYIVISYIYKIKVGLPVDWFHRHHMMISRCVKKSPSMPCSSLK